MSDVLLKVISKNEYDKVIDVSNIPAKHVRKRRREPFRKINDLLRGKSAEYNLKVGDRLNIIYSSRNNMGNSSFSDYVNDIEIIYSPVERFTDNFVVFGGGTKISKYNILAVIDDEKLGKAKKRKKIDVGGLDDLDLSDIRFYKSLR